MVAALFQMDVANASMYDGATALAEAVHMAVTAAKKKTRVVLSGTIHPNYLEVIESLFGGLPPSKCDAAIPATDWRRRPPNWSRRIDDNMAAVVVQYPNFFGTIEDLAAISDAVHAAGGVFDRRDVSGAIVAPETSRRIWSRFVTAEGQSLGVAQSFGGPYVGLLATRQEFVRQLPGRLAGITNDSEGKRGYVLALQTREQHIRREKATSNICTNQGLMATAATIYMSTDRTGGIPGSRPSLATTTRTIWPSSSRRSRSGDCQWWRNSSTNSYSPLRFPRRTSTHALLGAGIIGGYDLAKVDDSLDHACWLHDRADYTRRHRSIRRNRAIDRHPEPGQIVRVYFRRCRPTGGRSF